MNLVRFFNKKVKKTIFKRGRFEEEIIKFMNLQAKQPNIDSYLNKDL